MGTVSWTEVEASPILRQGGKGTWNELRADTGNSLVSWHGRWWLFHSGEDAQGTDHIGAHTSRARSLSGPWQPLPDNPLLDLGQSGQWDDRRVAHLCVVQKDDELWMYYSGSNGRVFSIGLAKSRDGIGWARLPDPVFRAGPSGAWDDAGIDQASVVFDGQRFVMAYRGWKQGDVDTQSQIGIATSEDGLQWKRASAGPVLDRGGPGDWDEYGLLAPRMWFHDGRYFLNYSGKNAATLMSSVGHAYADSLERWQKSPTNPMIFHGQTRYQEVEWATPAQIDGSLFLLLTAYYDGGLTTLWQWSGRK